MFYSCEFDKECFGYQFNNERTICFVLHYVNVSDMKTTFTSSEKNVILIKGKMIKKISVH